MNAYFTFGKVINDSPKVKHVEENPGLVQLPEEILQVCSELSKGEQKPGDKHVLHQ